MLLYMDEIIIPSDSEQNGIKTLQLVLNVAMEHGLDINMKKCRFLKANIEFLGHMIGNGEVKPSPTQIEAVQRFPKPRCVKDIQKFLGLS